MTATPVSPPDCPYLTSDLPGIGGHIKAAPEDFEVEEIPAYEPCGDGDHLFLWVEKRALSADSLIRHVAHILGLKPQDVGSAGLKDACAVTRQYLSVPAAASPGVVALDTSQIRVLKTARHRNKLKTGHLEGNRFRILVRDVPEDALARAQPILSRLRDLGVPNFFGPQRFGRAGETLAIGLALLNHERHDALWRAHPGRRGFLTRLALSAVQSAVFNATLARRMSDNLLHTVITGEVMQVCASGGPFVVEDVVRETLRFRAREIVPAGPMPGPKMREARGVALAREDEALRFLSLARDQFDGFGKIMLGTRRPNLVWPEALDTHVAENGLLFSFSLPSGAYATTVMRELMKNDGRMDEGDTGSSAL